MVAKLATSSTGVNNKNRDDGEDILDVVSSASPLPDIGQTTEHQNLFLQNYFNPSSAKSGFGFLNRSSPEDVGVAEAAVNDEGQERAASQVGGDGHDSDGESIICLGEVSSLQGTEPQDQGATDVITGDSEPVRKTGVMIVTSIILLTSSFLQCLDFILFSSLGSFGALRGEPSHAVPEPRSWQRQGRGHLRRVEDRPNPQQKEEEKEGKEEEGRGTGDPGSGSPASVSKCRQEEKVSKVPKVRAQEGDALAEEAPRRRRRQQVRLARHVDRVVGRLIGVLRGGNGAGGMPRRVARAQSEAARHRDRREVRWSSVQVGKGFYWAS